MSWRRRLINWLADHTAQVLFVSLLGSAVVTSAVSAVVRSLVTPSWEVSWVMWTSSALVGYVLLLKTSSWWASLVDGAGFRGPSPTVEMLEADRVAKLAKREQQVAGWRAMVAEIQTNLEDPSYHGWIMRTLQADPRFMALAPHLSEPTVAALMGRSAVVQPEGSFMRGELLLILGDIAELEHKWNLR